MNEQQERVAQAIYRKMPGSEAHPWVEGGNSLKQDEARDYARAALAAQGVPAGWKLAGYLYDFKDNGVTIPDWFTSRKAEAEAPGHFNVRDCYTPAPPQAQQTEIERLTECLRKANAQAEHFEREWYLRGDIMERQEARIDSLQEDLSALAAQAQQAAEVTLPPLPCHPEPHSHRWSKFEEATIKAYGELCAIVAQAATQTTPAQAQQAAPLTVPHPASEQASKAIDAELEARGWPSNTNNAARAGYEACRKLAGIGASSGSNK